MSIGAGEAILKQLQGQSKEKDVFMNRETRKEKGNFTIPYGRALGAPVSYTHLDVYKRQGRELVDTLSYGEQSFEVYDLVVEE